MIDVTDISHDKEGANGMYNFTSRGSSNKFKLLANINGDKQLQERDNFREVIFHIRYIQLR